MATLVRFFALDKMWRLMWMIRENGGPLGALKKAWRFDTLKEGVLMGEDKLGNKYYENQRYMIGRSRWVEYADYVRWEYDASQVTSEWFGWLHYKTDKIPSEDAARVIHPWMSQYEENLSGTVKSYMAYSTQPPRLLPWDGLSQSSRNPKDFQEIKPFDAFKLPY